MKTQQNQKGAALVVCLVLLLVLTVLGISTMSTASVELRMAANDRFLENAFQLAESGVDTFLRNLNNGTIIPAVTVPNTCFPAAPPVNVPQMNGSFQNTLCFLDTALDVGSGSSIPKIDAFHYQINSQGLQDRGLGALAGQGLASSLHRQGAMLLAPGE